MKEKQPFTTFDLVSVITLVFAALSLTGWIMSKNFIYPSMSQAQTNAEVLAHQLISGGLGSLRKTSNRAPASIDSAIEDLGLEGKISEDPWGKPFQYKFIGNKNNTKAYIIVWSSGPNQELETPQGLEAFVTSDGQLKNLHFAGDDLGYIKEVQ